MTAFQLGLLVAFGPSAALGGLIVWTLVRRRVAPRSDHSTVRAPRPRIEVPSASLDWRDVRGHR